MTIFLGFGAAFVGAADITEVDKAGNMAPAPGQGDWRRFPVRAHLGGCVRDNPRRGDGLVLSAASAFAHDFYGQIVRRGESSEKGD